MNVVNEEKEKRTCPRSNEFSATSKASSENEKQRFTRSGNLYGHVYGELDAILWHGEE
jgi:hypothetical protein